MALYTFSKNFTPVLSDGWGILDIREITVEIPDSYGQSSFEELISSKNFQAIRFMSAAEEGRNLPELLQIWETRDRRNTETWGCYHRLGREKRSLEEYLWDLYIADGEIRRAKALYEKVFSK